MPTNIHFSLELIGKLETVTGLPYSSVGLEEVSIKERKYAILYSSLHPRAWKVGVMARALAPVLDGERGNAGTRGKWRRKLEGV